MGGDILQFIVRAVNWRLVESAARVKKRRTPSNAASASEPRSGFSKSSRCCLTRSAFSPRALFSRGTAARAAIRLIERDALMVLALNRQRSKKGENFKESGLPCPVLGRRAEAVTAPTPP